MAQAPATILQEINGLYVALYDRAADNAGINFWSAQLGVTAAQAATTPITTAQATLLGQEFVTTQSTYFTATYAALNDIQFVEALYGNIGGNAGDPAGIQYWYGLLQAAEGGSTSPAVIQAARAGIVGAFVDQLLSIDLTVGAAVLGLSPTDYAAAVARQMELLNKISVSQFYANESALPGGTVLATPSTTSPAFQASIDVIGGVTNNPQTVTAAENAIVAAVAAGNLAPILALVTAPTQPNQTFTLTTNQDTFVGTGFNVFNAPLVGNAFGTAVPTLSSFDSLVSLPNPVPIGSTPVPQNTFSVLNANFSGSPSPQQPGSLNIQGIPVWNIGQDLGSTSGTTLQLVNSVIVPVTTSTPSVIILTGDAAGGPSIISGLMTLNFSDDETNGSLYIGDNSSPVYEPIINGVQQTANGFAINVYSAVGTGYNGVDVDLAASAFTGHDTINVIANVVGGFSQTNGSYNVPPEILIAQNDGDDYDPNWTGYLANEFSIGAGASAGPNGAIGFQTWNIDSIGAKAVGTLNIIGLGGEGSTTANFINLSDDGSNTMLFANAISDGLSTDWSNIKTINLGKTGGNAGTTGFVTITGLETNVQEVSGGYLNNIPPGNTPLTAANFASAFGSYGGGGLLASDTTALTSILGGLGNSFYDLSSLTPAAAHAGTWDGGHGTAGNSEIAFNNLAITTAGTITLTNIQILDDVSSIGPITVPVLNPDGSLGTAILENGGEAQGGIINMNNFAGLAPTNVPYALLAEDLGAVTTSSTSTGGGLGAPVPYGLPFTMVPAGITAASSIATDLQAGVIPAGFQVLQLLNAEGSTQTVLGAKLVIENGPLNFAINMQDTADGMATFTSTNVAEEESSAVLPVHGIWSGFDITITEGQPPSGVNPTTVNFANTLALFVSDDGVTLTRDPPGGVGAGEGNVTIGTASYVPELTIDNYSTVDIVLPTESVGRWSADGRFSGPIQNYVILGAQDPFASPGGLLNGPGFIDTPVVTVQNAVVNFYDNNADNGGSPPGGEDDLVLGFTNFTGTLTPAYIGFATVVMDTVPLDFATTINDFSTGSLEIGATNVTNLNAQSTSHLIMDLPASFQSEGLGGITVNGSLIGQNLEQGTSGQVMLDFSGHMPVVNGAPAIGNSVVFTDNATVLEAISPQANHGGWGNDTLTGGNGWGTATVNNMGGVMFTTFTTGVSNGTFLQDFGNPAVATSVTGGPGNTGDNFFGEGGNDIVNIAPGEVGTLTTYQDVLDSSGTVLLVSTNPYANFSTVWVGFYDVCNSAGENTVTGLNSGVGTVIDQAITDLSPAAGVVAGGAGLQGEEVFVDGYGNTGKDANDPTTTTSTPVVTINGFHFSAPLGGGTMGDTIVFGVASWAASTTTTSGTIDNFTTPTTSTDFAGDIGGLVQSDGNSAMGAALGFATYSDVNTGGAFASTTNLAAGPAAKVVLDSIGGSYVNAAALQVALAGAGHFNLAGVGVGPTAEVDILVGYQLAPSTALPNGAIAIADVTLTNPTAADITDTALLHAVVHDLVHIATVTTVVGLANLMGAHNIDFVA